MNAKKKIKIQTFFYFFFYIKIIIVFILQKEKINHLLLTNYTLIFEVFFFFLIKLKIQ